MSNMDNAVCKEFAQSVLPTMRGQPTMFYQYLCLVFVVLINLYFIGGLLGYFYYKKSFIRLQQRSDIMEVTSTIGIMMFSNNILVREFIGRDNYPCAVYLWLYHLALYLLVGPVVGSIYIYIYKLRCQRIQGYDALRLMGGTSKEPVHSKNGESSPARVPHGASVRKQGALAFFIDFFWVMKFSNDGKISYAPNSKAGMTITEATRISFSGDDKAQSGVDDTGSVNESAESVTSAISMFQFSSESTTSGFNRSFYEYLVQDILTPMLLINALSFPLIIATIIRYYTDPLMSNHCIGCELDSIDYAIKIGSVLSYLIMIALGIYSIRNEDDPLGMLTEMKIILICAQPTTLSLILLFIDPGNLQQQYVLSWELLSIPTWLGLYYSRTYFHIFTSLRERQRSSAAHVATSKPVRIMSSDTAAQGFVPDAMSLDLRRILNDAKIRNLLLEHAVNELSSENVIFVVKVRAWKSIWGKESPEKITKLAVQLYKEFIDRDSRTPINLPAHAYNGAVNTMKPFLQAAEQPPTSSEGTLTNDVSLVVSDGANINSATSLSPAKINVKKPPLDTFDRCETECMSIVETDTLPRFVKSRLFKEQVIDAGKLSKVMKM